MRQRVATSPRRRVRRAAAFIAVGSLLCGCETVQHGRATAEVAGMSLPTSAKPGADRLTAEIDYDSEVLATVRAHGRPEYLHVVDRDTVYLFYTELDRLVMIQRNLIPPGVATAYAPIPGHFLKLLPRAEIERNQARRHARKSKRSIARKRSKASAPPAARAPSRADAGRTLNRFDLETLIERFREPVSAADPGVRGWNLARRSDGTRLAHTRVGQTQYRIAPNTITVASPISAKSRKTPSELRMGYYRVNRAIFGTRAHAISKQFAPIVASVAKDPSGRTRVARRVAGRSVHVFRDTRRGLLVYRVGTD